MYLPTAGQDDLFTCALAALDVMLSDLNEKHDGQAPIFVRGDANASSKNVLRSSLLQHFLTKHNLHRLHISHLTYHHFIGNGLFDSDLDVVLYSNTPSATETLVDVICKLQNPLINSLHDIIISEFTLPPGLCNLKPTA